MNTLEPANVAKWLLIAMAGSTMAGLTAFCIAKGDFIGGVIFSAFTTGWLSIPAAIAALLARAVNANWISWSFVGFEAALVLSSWILLPPIFLEQDAQGGIAIGFLPIAQGIILAVFTIVIKLVAVVSRALNRHS